MFCAIKRILLIFICSHAFFLPLLQTGNVKINKWIFLSFCRCHWNPRQNPHLIDVHCVAHKLALCSSRAAADIPRLKQHQEILSDLFYYIKASGKRAAKIKQVQEILQDPILTYKELHSVWWLSYFNALTVMFRTLDILLTYLGEAGTGNKDPKAVGLKCKIATGRFISMTYLMMDAMAPVTILSQFF